MMGSAADADDVVQDTFERALSRPPADSERDLLPWLLQVALNLSRDQLRRRKRQGYTGPWLPAPVSFEGLLYEPAADARYGELESVSMAFLVALEALTATQRAVVLLTDVLGYSVREVAFVLAKSEGNVKVSHHRARAALASYDSTRVPLTQALQEQTKTALMQLMQSLQAGDVAALETQLSEDVRAVNDSDGEYHAAGVPVLGRERVIRFHLKLRREQAPRLSVQVLNGLPAVVAEFAEAPEGVAERLVFFVRLDAEGKVCEMNTVLASGKLGHVMFRGIA